MQHIRLRRVHVLQLVHIIFAKVSTFLFISLLHILQQKWLPKSWSQIQQANVLLQRALFHVGFAPKKQGSSVPLDVRDVRLMDEVRHR